MKYHGKIMMGSNQAGKGDKNRAFRVDKERSKEALLNKDKNFDKIFKNKDIEKKICDGCGKLKAIVRTIYKHNGEIENYCSTCRGTAKRKKR